MPKSKSWKIRSGNYWACNLIEMRSKFWVLLNVLIIHTTINAQQNFAPKDIVNLPSFAKATYRKMVQNLGWAGSQYSNLYRQPFSYLILPGENYARLSVRHVPSASFRRRWCDHDDKTIIKNYNNEANIQCFNCNYNHNIYGL